jgi:DNA polymerase phi
MPQLRRVLINVMSTACDETATLNSAQMKELCKLALLAVRQTTRIIPKADVSTIWEPNTWDRLCKKIAATERFKASTALQATCQQMVQTSRATTSPVKSKGARKDVKPDTPSVKRKKGVNLSGDEEKATPNPTKRKKVGKDSL